MPQLVQARVGVALLAQAQVLVEGLRALAVATAVPGGVSVPGMKLLLSLALALASRENE